jgi:DNA-binding MarR family transcriptional regulator
MPPPEPFLPTLHNWMEIFMHRLMHIFIQYVKANGLSISQINAMFHIFRKGSAGVSDIGDELGITSAAASQMLDRLVTQGLILRSEDPHDRRLKHIVLTAKGSQVLQESFRARQKWLEDLAILLTPAEQEQVTAALTILIQKASQMKDLPNLHP